MNDKVCLGYVARAFGIKGGLVIKLFNGHSQSLTAGVVVSLRLSEQWQSFVVDSIQNNSRVFFRGLVDRSSADNLVGKEIYIDRTHLPVLAEDEFYLGDLQGARVVNVEGVLMGFVTGFSSNNAQNLLDVKQSSGKIVSIPAIKPIVTKIDCDQKLVIIDPPLGLLDLAC